MNNLLKENRLYRTLVITSATFNQQFNQNVKPKLVKEVEMKVVVSILI